MIPESRRDRIIRDRSGTRLSESFRFALSLPIASAVAVVVDDHMRVRFQRRGSLVEDGRVVRRMSHL